MEKSQTKTLDIFFSNSQIKNVTPLETLSEYTGSDTGQIDSFFEMKHIRQYQ